MAVAIAILVALWAVAMLSRHAIWARWWGYRLRSAETAQDQLQYLQRLAALGEPAVPVAAGLLKDTDAGTRGLGVALLSMLPGDATQAHLLTAVGDADPDIRRLALEGYSLKPGTDVTTGLVKLTNHDDADLAMLATARLALSRPDQAVPVLMDAARQHRHVGVRIQAIQALGMHRNTEAIDVLIACLDDATPFSGQTVIDVSAERAFRAVQPTAAPDLEIPPQHTYTVGEEAAKALEHITGESIEYEAEPPEVRAACVQAWKRWRQTASQPAQSGGP